jgi:hypothetical protein
MHLVYACLLIVWSVFLTVRSMEMPIFGLCFFDWIVCLFQTCLFLSDNITYNKTYTDLTALANDMFPSKRDNIAYNDALFWSLPIENY